MAAHYVVTGANRGLGLEFVRALVKAGHRVTAACRAPRSAGKLQDVLARQTSAGKNTSGIHELDVTSDASVERFAEHIEGPVDVLINNAGVFGGQSTLASLDFKHLATQFETNSLGPMRITRALLANLRRGEGRKILNITSRMGSIADNSSGGHYGYRASKAALNMLNHCLAQELRDDGITSIVIHPGWVATDMGGKSAPLNVEDSVRGMLEVLHRATLKDSGHFLQYDGEVLPW